MPLIKLSNNAIKNVTSLPISVGTMNLISSQTASNSASISFTTGLDSTYKEYQFYFIDIHARTNATSFTFNMSTDSGSNYNVTKTTTFFLAYHHEGDSGAALTYDTAADLAQSTSFQPVATALSSNADDSTSGSMTLFNPSSTTYVKHYINSTSTAGSATYQRNEYSAGYGNTTSAVNAVQFKMASGNFDGTIALYGIV
jgi:hypothetical protein